MRKRAYELLIQNTRYGYLESAGILFGKRVKNNLYVHSILNLTGIIRKIASVSRTTRAKVLRALGGGIGGAIASEEVNKAVARAGPNVIGFYHSHPNNEPLSPADYREFKTMKKFLYLKRPSRFHILCRRSREHWKFAKFRLLPQAFIEKGIRYIEIPVILI